MSVGQELLNTPFPEMTQKLAFAVAEAQTKLDTNSSGVAALMADQKITLPKLDGKGTKEFPLLSLGFYPTFYQVQEAEIEVKMAITMATSTEKSGSASAKAGWGPFSASVNASYSSKYNFKQEGSSTLRMKLAPAPPPTLLETYMNALIETQRQEVEDALAKAAKPVPGE